MLSELQFRVMTVSFLLLTGCMNEAREDSSALKHQFGEVARNDKVLPDIFERSQCAPVDYLSLGDDLQFRSAQAKAQEYLADLSYGIIQRVNASLLAEGRPEVFTGALDPSRFCFNISDSRSPLMNASMRGQTLQLTVDPSVFARLSDESAIGAVVCHELAHASMRHADQSIRPDLIPTLLPTEKDSLRFSLAISAGLRFEPIFLEESIVSKIFGDYSDTAAQMFQIKYEVQDFIRSRIDAIIYGMATPGTKETQAMYLAYRFIDYVNLYQQRKKDDESVSQYWELLSPDERQSLALFDDNLRALGEDLIGEDPVTGAGWTYNEALVYLHDLAKSLDETYGTGELSFVNWMEGEADQVGLEFCARSGFDISKFDEFHRLSSNFQSSLLLGEQGDLESCLQAIDKGLIPIRSSDTHPSSCWRIFDTKYREPLLHKNDYEGLSKSLSSDLKPILGKKRLDDLKESLGKANLAL